MDKIVYALSLIVDFIYFNDNVDKNIISDYLRFTGLDECEVTHVLTILGINEYGCNSINAFRIFSQGEKRLFSQDALNYMNKLLLVGLLDIMNLEDVIERAAKLGSSKIHITTLKEIVTEVLYEKQLNTFSSVVKVPLIVH